MTAEGPASSGESGVEARPPFGSAAADPRGKAVDPLLVNKGLDNKEDPTIKTEAQPGDPSLIRTKSDVTLPQMTERTLTPGSPAAEGAPVSPEKKPAK